MAHKKLKIHPLAEMYEPIAGMASTELRKSIRDNGQLVPIIVHDGYILDGRSRYRECLALGKEPIVEQYKGKTDLQSLSDFVEALNEHRRHLNISQRGSVASQRKRLLGLTTAEVAKLMNVSERTVEMADVVHVNGSTAVVQAVKSGEVTVSDAASVADLPKSEQNAALKEVRGGKSRTLKQAATDFDTAKLDAKKRKQGRQTQSPRDRKEAKSVFGRLVRILDKLGLSPDLEGELKTILAAIKG